MTTSIVGFSGARARRADALRRRILPRVSKQGGPVMELARNLRVEPISRLQPPAPWCLPGGASVEQAMQLMRRHRTGCVLITEHLSKAMQFLNTDTSEVSADQADLTDLADLEGSKDALQSQETDYLIGVFTERDLLRRVLAGGHSLNSPLRHFMTPEPITVRLTDPISLAVRLMEEGGYRHLPVVAPIHSVTSVESMSSVDSVDSALIGKLQGANTPHGGARKTLRPIGILSVKRIVHYLVEHFPSMIYNLPPDPGIFPQQAEGA